MPTLDWSSNLETEDGCEWPITYEITKYYLKLHFSDDITSPKQQHNEQKVITTEEHFQSGLFVIQQNNVAKTLCIPRKNCAALPSKYSPYQLKISLNYCERYDLVFIGLIEEEFYENVFSENDISLGNCVLLDFDKHDQIIGVELRKVSLSPWNLSFSDICNSTNNQ